MDSVVPHREQFHIAEKLNAWIGFITLFTTIMSIVQIIYDCTNLSEKPFWGKIGPLLSPTILLGTILIIVLSIAYTFVYRRAEDIRRDSFADNSFGCLLSDEESIGYFSNDAINPSTKKALANLHENCFFSLSIVSLMCKKSFIRSCIILFLLLICIIYNVSGNKILLGIANILISLHTLQDFINILYLKKSLERVSENCKALWSSLSDKNCSSSHIIGKISRELIRYETALAYASIMLDSKCFKKINDEKTKEWAKLQKRFEILS